MDKFHLSNIPGWVLKIRKKRKNNKKNSGRYTKRVNIIFGSLKIENPTEPDRFFFFLLLFFCTYNNNHIVTRIQIKNNNNIRFLHTNRTFYILHCYCPVTYWLVRRLRIGSKTSRQFFRLNFLDFTK